MLHTVTDTQVEPVFYGSNISEDAEKIPAGNEKILVADEKVGLNSGFVQGICLSETNLRKQPPVIGDSSKQLVDEGNSEISVAQLVSASGNQNLSIGNFLVWVIIMLGVTLKVRLDFLVLFLMEKKEILHILRYMWFQVNVEGGNTIFIRNIFLLLII